MVELEFDESFGGGDDDDGRGCWSGKREEGKGKRKKIWEKDDGLLCVVIFGPERRLPFISCHASRGEMTGPALLQAFQSAHLPGMISRRVIIWTLG